MAMNNERNKFMSDMAEVSHAIDVLTQAIKDGNTLDTWCWCTILNTETERMMKSMKAYTDALNRGE